MRATHPTTAGRPRHAAAVLALVVSLLAAVGLMTSGTATAASTTPASIRIDSVTSDIAPPAGTPDGAVPVVLAKIGTTVHVNVSFYDSSGLPATFSKETAVTVTSDRGGLTQSIKTIPANQTTGTLDVSFSQAVNGVVLTATVGKGGKVFSDSTLGEADKVFDVAKLLEKYGAARGVSLTQGIGGDTACQNATSTNPICGVLVLPNGAQGSEVLLSTGVCDDVVVTCRSTSKGSVVQALADLSGGLYTNDAPATLILKCDKTLCPGGAIQSYPVLFSQAAAGRLQQADPCPAKATLGAGQQACVDYVQSTRDNSGDTHLYLLFTGDMRGSIG